MKNKYFGIVLLILTIVSCTSKSEKDKWAKENPTIKYSEAREKEVWGRVLRGDNPALFYGTPLYDLAEALSNDSFLSKKEEIIKLINEIPKEYINYQEGKFGHTIGHFALRTYNFGAIRKLLDKGLNPNLMDKSGKAIIIDINSSTYSYKSPENLKTLKYMIRKGANVNLYSKKAQFTTPLIEAAKSNFENVKILVESGANPHFINEFGYVFKSPLSAALLYKRIEIVNYLIFNQKVDFRTLKYPMDSKFHPGEYEILHNLRGEMLFKLNSKEYQEKMKLVAYLKTQGLDYWKTPIPDKVKTISNITPDYLSKY